MVMVMYVDADANVYLRLYLFTRMRIFMYKTLQLHDDYYVLMGHISKDNFSNRFKKSLPYFQHKVF